MKRVAGFAVWMLILMSLRAPVARAEAPVLGAEKAAKIASDYLRSEGLAKDHFISSLTLEPTSLLQRELHWIALWTPAIDLGNRKATGLQIAMDGSVARVVNKGAKK